MPKKKRSSKKASSTMLPKTPGEILQALEEFSHTLRQPEPPPPPPTPPPSNQRKPKTPKSSKTPKSLKTPKTDPPDRTTGTPRGTRIDEGVTPNALHGTEGEGGEREEELEPFVELRLPSREEEILRSLGVLHLDGKTTRPRYNVDETDVSILKEAGVHYVNTAEYEERANAERRMVLDKKKKKMSKEANEENKVLLTRGEAQLLRSVGVNWFDTVAAMHDQKDKVPFKLCDNIPTSTMTGTTTATLGETSTVNSSYAERELMRRLKRGWTSTGDECRECGMPVICKGRGSDMFECVICGVVGGHDDDDGDYNDGHGHDAARDSLEGRCNDDPSEDGPGVFEVGTAATYGGGSTIASSVGGHNERYTIHMMEPVHEMTAYHNNCEGFTKPVRETSYNCEEGNTNQPDEERDDSTMYCDHLEDGEMYDQSSYREEIQHVDVDEDYKGDDVVDDDEAYKEEIGNLLFEGWELTKLTCPHCNLPLMSNGEDDVQPICLRCG
mmetsp:Transcript_6204/g.13505  ORF Transcript_6204/g.13505 Transcript_6204/m.13505 type:complete len:498 (+) Transcript_6204:265-1758(+)